MNYGGEKQNLSIVAIHSHQNTTNYGMASKYYSKSQIVNTLCPLVVGGLIKKRGLAIFPEEINREGVNKWKWVDFVMQCLNRGVVNSWWGNINSFKLC